MSRNITINQQSYIVKTNEYPQKTDYQYNNLKIVYELDTHERLLGLFKRLRQCFPDEDAVHFLSLQTTHGGFIPLNLSDVYDKCWISETDTNHYKNISLTLEKNKKRYKNISLYHEFTRVNDCGLVVFCPPDCPTDLARFQGMERTIIVATENYEFQLSGSPYSVHVSQDLQEKFRNVFKYFLKDKNTLEYDNLLHLCIMVKNAGPQFESMLKDNMDICDMWTILDTGSTDDTVDYVHRVLIGKKEGALYQEEFINFRDSRNRLLDLAGTECTFTIMLDDSYVVQGDIRGFLKRVRGDTYASSFSTYVESGDSQYVSNRIVRSILGLRYKFLIHEVIQDENNRNVCIPLDACYLLDRRFDYHEERTTERKKYDLELLSQEVEDDVNNPRTYYYFAQTYSALKDYEKAFKYFQKRCEFVNSGFLQERVDAMFESARLANFFLHRPWDECEKLYMKAYHIDESRPDPLYFIGIHYYLEGNFKKSFEFFKKAFELGFPVDSQYSLKPTLTYHFNPKFLGRVCYHVNEFQLGEEATAFFLKHNSPGDDDYQEMLSWNTIYKVLNTRPKEFIKPILPSKRILCFIADGGFHPWTGENLKTTGVGGSETFIIEIARHIQKTGEFKVHVFCRTPSPSSDSFEDVMYHHIDTVSHFVYSHYIHTCIVSRFSEYIPILYNSFVENVYLILHDLSPSGNVIPLHRKLKNIFCLTPWHVSYFSEQFPAMKEKAQAFSYGIDLETFSSSSHTTKVPFKFIYSSFPNRGLLELLKMWPSIRQIEPRATLDIFCNLDHEWSNRVEPEKMNSIRTLLHLCLSQDDKMGIVNHGWVSKKELAHAWSTAQIWFYPCTFRETFCLTALEAAASETLVISNHLAALKDTVGDRGIIIDGDPTQDEWKERAFAKIKEVFNDVSAFRRYIQRNKEWAVSTSWKSQADRLIKLVNKEHLEYKNMYNWTHDLPSGGRKQVLDILKQFNTVFSSYAHVDVLEIGTYSGTSLIEIIKHIPNATGVGLDAWEDYDEGGKIVPVASFDVMGSFFSNIKKEGLHDRIYGIKSRSADQLMTYMTQNTFFHFIYVDGSHMLCDTYLDLMLAWKILVTKGFLLIDDYLFQKDDIVSSPYEAVNRFLYHIRGQYNTIHKGYRVCIQKISNV